MAMPFIAFEDWEEFREQLKWEARVSKCNPTQPKNEHHAVKMAEYNTSGALLGPHFRCEVCNAVWNQYAESGDLPDPPSAHSK